MDVKSSKPPEGQVESSPQSGISTALMDLLARKLVGQPAALQHIVPYIQTHQSGLAPQGRPLGVFLLLGPTGTGKTRTVEVLAEALHGSHQRFLAINCGEFQLDHEVARLTGAPPGYLGHRDTVPLLSAQRLAAATSPACDISLVLFDEIEKAAPSLNQLLLGILDKATLQLGDNTDVNFEKSLIFLTSNLGAREMMGELNPSMGFRSGSARERGDVASKLESIAMIAVRKKFSPEFINRIDAVVTYQPLTTDSLSKILEQQIDGLQSHLNSRLGSRSFTIELTPRAKEFLIERGTSTEYGARELKRIVHRHLTQPLATMVAERRIRTAKRVLVDMSPAGDTLNLNAVLDATMVLGPAAKPILMIVDDNAELLKFLTTVLQALGIEIITAETGEQAINLSRKKRADVALVDYLLPDLDGLKLGTRLQMDLPFLQVIIMTGEKLSSGDEERCTRDGWALIQKPFLVEDLMEMVRSRLPMSAVAAGGPTSS
jgi:ATP-dependent Clp protease ATP-binding subunit ClpA/CheY-like chemotaxis protein